MTRFPVPSELERVNFRSRLHNQIAWTSYVLGDIATARTHAEQAVAADAKYKNAQSVLANTLIATGDAARGFKLLEQLMRKGHDPSPNAELRADPRYLELATRYRIPVEV